MGHRKPDIRPGDPPYPEDRWKPQSAFSVNPGKPGAWMAIKFWCKCPDCGQWVDAMAGNIRPPQRVSA
jgi:hypothetical protein